MFVFLKILGGIFLLIRLISCLNIRSEIWRQFLTHLRSVLSSYRNQLVALHSTSIDWFLDNEIIALKKGEKSYTKT